MPEPVEYQFEVIARVYSHLKAFGEKPNANLLAIGKEMGLTDKQINSARLRASHHVKKQGRPKDVDEKGWVWPSQKEALHA